MGEKQSVGVVVDSREPTETLIPHLTRNPEVEEFAIEELPVGDLLIEDVIFERKTPSDYASSIMDSDDHLKDQVERMGDAHDHGYILIEGDMSDFDVLSHTQIPAASLRGFAASLMARQGIPVIPCSDSETLVDMAVRLARKHIETPSNSSLRIKSSVGDGDEPVVKRMYGCIDGVGPDTATALHTHYPSLQDALDASVAEFTTIDGIGQKTAQQIHTALHDTEIGVTTSEI